MTAKKKTPAKRGRKPAPPGGKLSQLTIRLPPTQRLGLAMLARDRGFSISQAVEYAVAQVLREYSFENSNLEDFLFTEIGVDGSLQRRGPAEAEELADAALGSEPLFVLLMPERLRLPEEEFFVGVLRRIWVFERYDELPITSALVDQLLAQCRNAFRKGITSDEVVEEWKALLAERQG